jgi:hypothetical protein
MVAIVFLKLNDDEWHMMLMVQFQQEGQLSLHNENQSNNPHLFQSMISAIHGGGAVHVLVTI